MLHNGGNEQLTDALQLAVSGFRVFPLKPGQKTPAITGWQQAATTDETQIRNWWRQNPSFNIGIPMGSGIFAVDLDCGHREGVDGRQTLTAWTQEHGDFPQTVSSKTANGGEHLVFRGSAPNRANVRPGVDVRGEGGYIVAPGSVVDGRHYRWEHPPVLFEIAEANENVYAFITQGKEFERNTGIKRSSYHVPKVIEHGARTSALVALAGSLIGKGLTPEAAEAAIREENELRCNPPLTDEELQREVLPALRREKWQVSTAPYMRDLPINAALVEKLCALDPVNSKRYGWNDAGAARLFIDTCGDYVQYVSDRKKWVFYDGRRWDVDGENAVREKLKELADALTVYGLRDVADDRRADFLKYAAKWQQLRTRETILKDAASVRPVKSDLFDRLPLVLNVQNGTLDLQEFTLKPHHAGDMVSRCAAVVYDPAVTSPRWLRFIDEITAGDKETARYLQKAAGYALTGDTRQECLFILYGATSRNGKSTLLETLAVMLGDYAATANPESFIKSARSNDNAPSEDIARLAGVRFVTVTEPPRGMELNAALVKQLTGRDTVKARRLYESSFEYTPAFKLFFNTNHRPRIDDMTVFQSDRVKLIPFNVHFGEDKRDPHLKDELQTPESLSGVLNWALDGLRLLRAEGFAMPPAVVQATAEYRRKMDKLGQFLEEHTETGAGYEVPLMTLHDAFGTWCSSSGLAPVGVPRFKELLEERQITTKKKRPAGSGRAGKMLLYALGLRLIPEK